MGRLDRAVRAPGGARARLRASLAACAALAILAVASTVVRAAPFSESISVTGDSISRGFNANTGSCNYGDNPGRAWATGRDHGSNWCQSGGDGTFTHAERLECAKGAQVSIFNDSMSGGTMLSDFRSQSSSIRQNLSGAAGPRYVTVLMGHNDACTNTVDRTGNSCGGDRDPNNYCRTTKAAFEREFRAGLDHLIRIPSARILVLATIRISQLCNLASKSSCGLGLGISCNSLWRTLGAVNGVFGTNGVCLSLTDDCSDQRRVDMYNTLAGYNEVLSRVSAEYAAIPVGGTSATGATRAADVVLRFRDGTFDVKLSSSDLSCCDCFHPSDQGHQKLARFAWDGFQCSEASPCCATSGVAGTDAACSATDVQTFHPGGFWPNDVACGNDVVDPTEQCGEPSLPGGSCCNASCRVASAGTVCRAAAGTCDVVESCSGASAECPADVRAAAGSLCRASAGGCDPVETCDGSAAACPPDARSSAGTVCREGGPCDVAETCDGSSTACPSDAFVAAGTACPDDGSVCSFDRCDGAGRCAHPPTNAGLICRAASGTCDLAETCTGTDPACPADVVRPANTTCRSSTGECDPVERCGGVDGSCPADVRTAAGTACTDDGRACTFDQCDGSGTCAHPARPAGTTCPDDGSTCTTDQCDAAGTCAHPARPAGTVCRAPSGACDAAETCDGTAAVCPGDALAAAGTTCRPASGACDLPETCTGTSSSCPGDAVAADGSGCSSDADPCTLDACLDGTCEHVADDGDADGTCDALDACTLAASADSSSWKLSLANVVPSAGAGRGKLSLTASFRLPGAGFGDLRLATNGFRLAVASASGAPLFEATVPPGTWDGQSGWKLSVGKSWTFSTRGTQANGVSKVQVVNRSSTSSPGLVKVVAVGTSGTYPVTPADLPLRVAVALGAPVDAALGRCGEVAFGTGTCLPGGGGTTVACRR
ncbi:hypothetical protein KGQ64_00305 [bacterium]|nr:hypothetical protein [bacterium]